ncbi:EAL domain-containing protein [Shewanella sp. D64]|uniref:putative bifunctional diguanylate cyclase/phosphodiesterase n=1 Tax=unclassified Shewanella TaxID=196818 RepID=UPI0022BA4BEA|nr:MULTISPECIES: EAL domain-containing protein [unclassified Shewanella]MEC4728382.1 EAL domain-containing protein [Shewanella sp. D64]MEC4740415.1 EAL domain-containing protein [Shewanella sp. E94]WBJ95069.1 EAL domain-containing protein [Shewanella sp. MTB7]
MHIGKKLIIFVVGFCLPAVIAVSYCLSMWFEHRVDRLRKDAVSSELVAIKAQLNNDIKQLTLLADVYAVPITDLSPLSRLALDEAWRSSALSNKFSLFYLNQGELAPFSPFYDDTLSFEFDKLPREFLASTKVRSGVYIKDDNGFIVSLVPVTKQKSVLVVRQLTENLLSGYGLNSFVQKIDFSPGPAGEHYIVDGTKYIVDLDVPSIFPQQQSHLEVHFSTDIFNKLWLKYDLATFASVGLGLFIVIIGYIWLKLGLIRPFHRLMVQLAEIDPNAQTYKPIEGTGCSEFVVMADQVNTLLERIIQQKERAKITLESIAEAVILTDTFAKVVYLNPQAECMLDLKGDEAIGISIDSLLKADKSIRSVLFSVMANQVQQTVLNKHMFKTENARVMERSISNLLNHKQEVIGSVIVLRDITQEEKLTRQLRLRANFDPITSLLNRRAFEEALAGFSQNAQSLAICYFDLEQFKLINDSCGHSAGDQMLAMVAKAIQSCLNQEDLLARLGGDEFGLAIRNLSAVEVAKIVKRVISRVSLQVLHHNGCNYRVGISAGIAIARPPYIISKELVKDADIACLAAKRKGSNQIHFYDNKDKESIYQRNAPMWAVRISQAIEHNELLLYYQEIKGMGKEGKRQRMEILLRVQEPNGRILAPAQFIEAAERFKLMNDVDKEVIRKAFLWLSLNEDIWDDHCISINLSGNSLGAEGMVEYIAEQFERFEIPSQCICFEITETSAIQNRNRAMDMINHLRKLGFSFALDDFGSGFASYGYLKELPVDYVKIDGCFIKNLATNAKDFAIVKSIHDVCGVMGIETVAEFVENQDIIDKLEMIGINYAQGYAIGRPKPLSSYVYSRLSQTAKQGSEIRRLSA